MAVFGFWADRPFRFVAFDVPAQWGMGSGRGDRKLTILGRTLVHELESDDRPDRRMQAIERYLAAWRSLAATRRWTRAGEPAVRDRIWHFVRNRVARLFGYDPAFIGRVLEKQGI